MQMQRLFEIVYFLMEKGHVTAAELARRLEVSPRTIYRDIDALSAAGIPIYASKGKGGGIALLDNFVLNKSLLSEGEQREILSALQSMLAITPREAGDSEVLGKLTALFKREAENWLDADFSDWGGNSSFHLLKEAILGKRVVCFSYASTYGENSLREVEPLQLRFKHKAWYLYAYCRLKQDYRLFKLSRIRNLQLTETSFLPPATLPSPMPPEFNAPLITLKLKIASSQAYRVYDEFAPWQIEQLPDGGFLATVPCIEDEWIYGFILSFGAYAEVTEPERLRLFIRERLREALKNYL